MTDKGLHIAVVLTFCVLAFVTPVQAQFINLQLRVEPELSATVEQNLDFGTQVTNSGITQIRLGDVNMGVFSIRAIRTQNIYLSLQYPEALVNENAPSVAQIPMQLEMAYNNTGTNKVENAKVLPISGRLISIHENTAAESEKDIWKEMYIYVYGAIDVGNIPNGIYTADIILSVDYD